MLRAADAGHAFGTIPRRWSQDPAIFEIERTHIFRKSWQYVAHESELETAGSFATADVGGESVIVARDKHGELRAFANSCSHKGAALTLESRGICPGTFRCPYHGWVFDLEGRLAAVPRPKGYGPTFNKAERDLPAIRVESFAGFVFVNLDNEGAALSAQLGDIGPHLQRYAQNLEVIGRVSWTLAANWKAWPENYRDGYHPEAAHKMIGVTIAGEQQTPGRMLSFPGGHSLSVIPFAGPPIDFVRLKYAVLGLEPPLNLFEALGKLPPFPVDFSEGSVFLAAFPNFDYSRLFGGAGHAVQVLRPVSVDRTIVDMTVFGVVGEPESARLYRLRHSMDSQASFGKVSGDDSEIMVRLQTGTQSLSHNDIVLTRGRDADENEEITSDHAGRDFYAEWSRHVGIGPLEPARNIAATI